MANVVIVGCGYVGSALAQGLVAAGHTVWGVRRNPSKLPGGIQPIACNLADLATLRFETAPDYVFYMPSAGQYDATAYQATYVNGANNLLDCLAANNAKIKRLFYVSSTSVYAQTDGSWVDENTPAESNGVHAELLLTGEQVFRQSNFPATIVRFGGIYGPERTYFLEKVRAAEMLQSPEPLYTNRIHRDDCAGMLEFLLNHPAPDDLYIGVDCEPALKNTVIAWLAEQLNVPLPPVATATAASEKRMRGNKRCSNKRLLAAGYQFKYPSFRDGYLIDV